MKAAVSFCTLVSVGFLFSAVAMTEQLPVLSEMAFSKVDSRTGEHCDGWTVEIWRAGNNYLGELHHHRGLCGDPPMGLLENIRYDRESGRLSFTSRISDGVDGRGSPTCDQLAFKGGVDDARLQGVMEWRGGHVKETIDLPRQSPSPEAYASEKAWLDARKSVLSFRGPKCK